MIEIDWSGFGADVKRWRLEQSLTLDAMREAHGVTEPTVCRVENGLSCSTQIYLALCMIIGADPLAYIEVGETAQKRQLELFRQWLEIPANERPEFATFERQNTGDRQKCQRSESDSRTQAETATLI